MTCVKCGVVDELRGGFCFDCATAGDRRLAQRTVIQHLGSAVRHLARAVVYGWRGEWPDARNVYLYARIDLRLAWERFRQTGDYRPCGRFDRDNPGWRAALSSTPKEQN
jgi:hypothetical protein